MADKIKILYFLEDRAQESFVTALVEKVAEEESLPGGILKHDVRSARGGSRSIKEFMNFISIYEKTGTLDFDLLVVAIDGNCKGHSERKKELEKCITRAYLFEDKVVFAVPDPHIERWYILDQRAFKKGVGIDKAPPLPQYKCERNHYKQLLIQTLKEAGVNSLFGGAEYAERIVEHMENIDILDRANAGFKVFIRELRRKFRSILTMEKG
ncbi:MAG: hypothetical protein KAW12_16740 [Candidatus Aminicenantes bacterium]|nr:hypothetical protein [Candidatus Aminicenantes bacterium]